MAPTQRPGSGWYVWHWAGDVDGEGRAPDGVAFGLGDAATVGLAETCATGLDDDRTTGALPQPARRNTTASAAAAAPGDVGLIYPYNGPFASSVIKGRNWSKLKSQGPAGAVRRGSARDWALERAGLWAFGHTCPGPGRRRGTGFGQAWRCQGPASTRKAPAAFRN